MDRHWLIYLGLLLSLNIFGTIQIPDLLIVNGDTVCIETYPLESYLNSQDFDIDSVFIKDCFKTSCWRGYQAVWKIESDSLFLVSILDCCSDERLNLTDSVYRDLEELLSPEVMETLAPFRGNNIHAHFALERLKHKMGEIEYYRHKDDILKIALRKRKSIELSQIFDSCPTGNNVYAFWFSGSLLLKSKRKFYKNETSIKKSTLVFKDGRLI